MGFNSGFKGLMTFCIVARTPKYTGCFRRNSKYFRRW